MDVKEEVLDFISRNEKNGALLLTGRWGSGKTYLIHRVRDELNAGSEYAIVLVSLFGIDSLESLNKKVKEKVFRTMMGAEIEEKKSATWKKAKNALSTMSAAFSEISNIAKGVSSVLSISPYDFITIDSQIACRQDGEVKHKKLVLVFDDFERCRINKVELLGAINDYSENNGIKTILIADEEHIKGEEYREFKEKLVSRTVKLKGDYTDVLWSIIENYKESSRGYQKFLEDNIGTIALLFLESKTENIRSLKALLLDFERVYQAWKESDVPYDNLANVLYAFGAILFEFKNNSYQKHEEYGYIFADGDIKKKYADFRESLSLSSLRKWITEGEWNKKLFLNEINKRFNFSAKTPAQLFLYHEFWDLTQELVFEGLPVALQKAYEGQLSRDELMHLLQRVYLLIEYEVPVPVEVDYEKLSKGIDLREEMMKAGDITHDDSGTFILGEVLQKMDPKARQIYRRIEKLDDRCEAWKNRRSFIEFIETRNTQRHQLKHIYLVSFDKELLNIFFKAYKRGGNGEKRELFLTLKDLIFNDKTVSSDEDIQETLTNMSDLETMIRDLLSSEQDAIAKVNLAETLKALPGLRQALEDGD